MASRGHGEQDLGWEVEKRLKGQERLGAGELPPRPSLGPRPVNNAVILPILTVSGLVSGGD